MNAFVIALQGPEHAREWTMQDATACDVDPLSDVIRCINTRTSLKIVMRFYAPSWEAARRIFDWKSRLDRRVPKHVLSWEEARILAGVPCSKEPSIQTPNCADVQT